MSSDEEIVLPYFHTIWYANLSKPKNLLTLPGRQGDHRMALVYLMKAEKILESADNLDAVVARATWNAMGLAYNALGQPDEVGPKKVPAITHWIT